MELAFGVEPHRKISAATFSATDDVVIVSPFIKVEALSWFLDKIQHAQSLTLVTRWRLEELASGVTDIGVYEAVKQCNISTVNMYLVNGVHAKYFRIGETIYTGSANLTSTGFGLFGSSIELLEQTHSFNETKTWEYDLLQSGQLVTDSFANLVRLQLDQFMRTYEPVTFPSIDVNVDWLPESSYIELHEYFASSAEGTDSNIVASDLQELGFNSNFNACHIQIIEAILQTRIFIWICSLDHSPIHFGEIRRYLSENYSIYDLNESTKRIFDWVVFFLGEQYEYRMGNHSEMLFRI